MAKSTAKSPLEQACSREREYARTRVTYQALSVICSSISMVDVMDKSTHGRHVESSRARTFLVNPIFHHPLRVVGTSFAFLCCVQKCGLASVLESDDTALARLGRKESLEVNWKQPLDVFLSAREAWRRVWLSYEELAVPFDG
ncbi:hypothetical protein PsorP6_007233 [Peronosclerospora sorghi]|uniref:Uncharacterized protein n=1 Tax=Peronosclerospora sorghi TaxID=230839 RepID=A0ACC0W879_9STRA|nr:hypothetical protein PsorP6_007233 [Peronosclerospora sorghi]